MANILVLGAGMIGKAIVHDLAETYNVIVADGDSAMLDACTTNCFQRNLDFTDTKQIERIVDRVSVDLIVGAMPGALAYKVLESIIPLGIPIVDISFFEEDVFGLDALAKKHGVFLAVDCGFAPGLSNMFLGYDTTTIRVNNFECYCAGLPFERKLPWEYKSPFAVTSVIDEYTREAGHVRDGEIVFTPPISDIEPIEISFGLDRTIYLEAFNTDGLRTLLHTMCGRVANVPNMIEKTMRYPGHAELAKAFRDSGLFSNEKVIVGRHKISPRMVTEACLSEAWKLKDTDDEFTVLEATSEGKTIEKDHEIKIVHRLFDRRDYSTGLSSMSRVTGFTCAAVARMFLENVGNIKATQGIVAPEVIGRSNPMFHFLREYLLEKKIQYQRTIVSY